MKVAIIGNTAIGLVAATTLLSSCQTKQIQDYKTVTDSTTTTVLVTPRDTVIIIPEDSTSLIIPLRPDSSGLIQLPKLTKKNNQARLTVSITDGVLDVQSNCDSLLLELTLKDSTITTLRNRSESSQQTITETEEVIPWWAKGLSVLGALDVLGLIIFIAIKIFK